jgi:hypothetical protein
MRYAFWTPEHFSERCISSNIVSQSKYAQIDSSLQELVTAIENAPSLGVMMRSGDRKYLAKVKPIESGSSEGKG